VQILAVTAAVHLLFLELIEWILTLIGLVTACKLLIAGERRSSPMWSHTPHPIPRPDGRKMKWDNECLTTVTLLAGSLPWPFL